MSNTTNVQRLGKSLAAAAACAFAYMGYQAMKLNEREHHTPTHGAHAPHEFLYLNETLERTALLALLLAAPPLEAVE